MLKHIFFYAAFACVGGFAQAQSLSVADLQAQIDAELSKGNEYAELLNDPDPARALKAMELMLASGDEVLMRIALEYGVFSPDTAVRTKAVKAYFDGSPTVRMVFDASKSKEINKVDDWSRRHYRAALDANNIGVIVRKISDFSTDDNCYVAQAFNGYDKCHIRISAGEMQFFAQNGSWHRMKLDDAGTLISEIEVNGQKVHVAIPIE